MEGKNMVKSESESRRVKMTKRMLKDALIELMEEKPLAAVSVTDLCKLADVNRSTFYSYYNDTIELLKEIENDVIEKIPVADAKRQRIGLDQRLIEDFTQFFSYVRKNARVFNILLQTGGVHFSECLTGAVMQRFPKLGQEVTNPLLTQWVYIYAISGVISMMREWIRGGFPLEDRAFAELALQMSFSANDAPLLQSSDAK